MSLLQNSSISIIDKTKQESDNSITNNKPSKKKDTKKKIITTNFNKFIKNG